MKYLLLLFLAILINACSGTKHVVETTPNISVEKIEVVNDSISPNNKSAIVSKETLKDSI